MKILRKKNANNKRRNAKKMKNLMENHIKMVISNKLKNNLLIILHLLVT